MQFDTTECPWAHQRRQRWYLAGALALALAGCSDASPPTSAASGVPTAGGAAPVTSSTGNTAPQPASSLQPKPGRITPEEALANWEKVFAVVDKEHKRAMALQPTRRLNNECIVRMKEDRARLQEMMDEVDRVRAKLPAGAEWVKTWLSHLQSCVDCSGDPKPCEWATKERKYMLEQALEWKTERVGPP